MTWHPVKWPQCQARYCQNPIRSDCFKDIEQARTRIAAIRAAGGTVCDTG